MMSTTSLQVDVPVPPGSVSFDDRGTVLRVLGVAGGPLELRVDDGLVFARYLSQEPRLWTAVSLPSVMEFFAQDSPVSTWVRKQGAFPLKQLIVDSLVGPDDAGDLAS